MEADVNIKAFKRLADLCRDLAARFPRCWFLISDTHDVLASGIGSWLYSGLGYKRAFAPYKYPQTDGVHPHMYDFLASRGYGVEWLDDEIVLIVEETPAPGMAQGANHAGHGFSTIK